MISTAIAAVKSTLTGLGVIDRYGGLTIPVSEVVQVDEDRFTTRTYPVREGVDARDCFTGGEYQKLLPDDRYQNLVYWEEGNGMAMYIPPRNEDLGNKYIYLRGTARLVYWLNLPLMGHDGGTYRTVGDRFAWTLIDTLSKQFGIADPNYQGASVRFDDPVQVRRNTDIFAKYSYDLERINTFVLYPYDFGAIDWTVKMVLPKNCLTRYESLGSPIECVTEW